MVLLSKNRLNFFKELTFSNKFFNFLVISFTLIFNCSAEACNQMSIAEKAISPTQSRLSITIRRNNKNTECRYVLGVDKGQQNNGTYNRYLLLSGGGFSIPIQFWKSDFSQVIRDLVDASPPNNVINNAFTKSQSITSRVEELTIIKDPGGVAFKKGRYTNSFNVKLYTSPLTGVVNYNLIRTVSRNMSFTNPAAIQTSVVEAGAAFQEGDSHQELDFGNLHNQAAAAFDLLVKNNNSFRFTMNSANGGYIVRESGSTNKLRRIKFKLVLSATAFNPLTTINTFPYTSPTIRPSIGIANRFPFTATLSESISQKHAGLYTDNVTINFTAL